MSHPSLTSKINLSPDVLIQELAGESVLLNLKSEEYFGLDDIGTRMIAVLDQAESIQAAHDILLTEYNVESAQLTHDLLQFVLKLTQNGLVIVND
ncbi:PqqD family protein [Spirulina major CS-329]|jgi:hypothetical protein|uniref:PqqD family protein n=1 Tax=Spirulina TaxID=1154 RepID=UPI00232F6246|nr:MULTISPECIES: PqqD family protein [Spirulina]MDB9494394.1 PqqD family protein [Spirulina subsalsa CS-330]MDB9503953.1 PqqD family protein [Spirulina major CS-329]